MNSFQDSNLFWFAATLFAIVNASIILLDILQGHMSRWGHRGDGEGGLEQARATFDGDKLDHNDTKPEAFIRG
jgi:hypothetical protein